MKKRMPDTEVPGTNDNTGYSGGCRVVGQRAFASARGLNEFSGLDVSSANTNAADGAVLIDNSDALQVGFPTPGGEAGHVLANTALTFGFSAPDDPVAFLRLLSAVVTYPSHDELPIKC